MSGGGAPGGSRVLEPLLKAVVQGPIPEREKLFSL